MRHGKTILVDLRKVGLSRDQWRALRLEAKELGVPMETLGRARRCRVCAPQKAAEGLKAAQLFLAARPRQRGFYFRDPGFSVTDHLGLSR
jgi:hypothetical protein